LTGWIFPCLQASVLAQSVALSLAQNGMPMLCYLKVSAKIALKAKFGKRRQDFEAAQFTISNKARELQSQPSELLTGAGKNSRHLEHYSIQQAEPITKPPQSEAR
jgi:hypothetical protein